MNESFGYLATLSGTPAEQAWLQERLETLSEWERLVLTAEKTRSPPATAAEAVKMLCSLESGMVIPAAAGYEELGEYKLHSMGDKIPEELAEYIDLRALGQRFEDEHSGLFVDSYYVAYPSRTGSVPQDLLLPEADWSVKLKLASPAKPEGVWLRLPDYIVFEHPGPVVGEVSAVQRALQVESLDDCVLLEARCILPEAGNIMEQYDKISDLVLDGNNLGFILDEKDQGKSGFDTLYAAALEYEDCRTLRYALDISQNLRCYEWVPINSLKDFAADHLRSRGLSETLIQSGAIDFEGYAEDLLETSGYMLTRDESGYVARNTQKFTFEYCTQEEADGLSMRREGQPSSEEGQEKHVLPEDILNSFRLLSELAACHSAEECAQAEQGIRKALEKRGPEGLRQLQAAMAYEDCAKLDEAVQIAAHLDCYQFTESTVYQSAANSLLAKLDMDEETAARCLHFDVDAYAMLKSGHDDLILSSQTGLYVHKSDESFQLDYWRERNGPSCQSM